MSWQPIETAPKDGTDVFLLFPNGCPEVGYYVSEQVIKFGELARETHEWRSRQTIMALFGEVPQPTHWMPIPDAPRQ